MRGSTSSESIESSATRAGFQSMRSKQNQDFAPFRRFPWKRGLALNKGAPGATDDGAKIFLQRLKVNLLGMAVIYITLALPGIDQSAANIVLTGSLVYRTLKIAGVDEGF